MDIEKNIVRKSKVSPNKIIEKIKVRKGINNWIWLIRTAPPRSKALYHEKNPIHWENNAVYKNPIQEIDGISFIGK